MLGRLHSLPWVAWLQEASTQTERWRRRAAGRRRSAAGRRRAGAEGFFSKAAAVDWRSEHHPQHCCADQWEPWLQLRLESTWLLQRRIGAEANGGWRYDWRTDEIGAVMKSPSMSFS